MLKMGPTGEALWLTDVDIPGVANYDGGPRVGTAVNNMVVDAAGNVYLTGKAYTQEHGYDTFAVVLDPYGQLRCGWTLGTEIPTRAWELAVGPDGVLVISGETYGPTAGPHRGELDVFIIAYDLIPLTMDSAPPNDAAEAESAD